MPELPLPKSFEDVELGTWVTKVPAAVAARTVDDHLELNPAVSVAGGAVAMHAAGTAAASQGLTVRMLVVLTDERIIICDWVDGSGPTRELEHFDRDSTEVSINKSGLARILKLSDAGTGLDLELSGSTSLLSRQAKADKDVLAHLFDGVT